MTLHPCCKSRTPKILRRHSWLSWRAKSAISAVDRISFDIMWRSWVSSGECCGKTTTGRLILRLIESSGGQILIRSGHHPSDRRAMTLLPGDADHFQDPYASLNPGSSGEAIAEPPVAHGLASRTEAKERVMALLRGGPGAVSLQPLSARVRRSASAWVARSLVMNPGLWSPMSLLRSDVPIRAQIINLLQHIQAELQLTFCFISRSGVVRHLS